MSTERHKKNYKVSTSQRDGLHTDLLENLLANWPAVKKKERKEAVTCSVETRVKHRRKTRKLNPEVVDTLNGNRHLTMQALIALVVEKHNISLSPGSVYKAWKGQHL